MFTIFTKKNEDTIDFLTLSFGSKLNKNLKNNNIDENYNMPGKIY
jgi:hypothetical protein